MKQYHELLFERVDEAKREELIALFTLLETEGFEEGEHDLRVFLADGAFDAAEVQELAGRAGIAFTHRLIPETNWNELWESNFQPVIVDDFVAVRAGFHAPVPGVMHELVITPKMSFGTGHHATTYMMMQQMRNIEWKGRSVFDFGTGTGVLAILAARLGASFVEAVDNDDWSIENAAENIQRNEITTVHLRKADTAVADRLFDIILANINRHILLDNMRLLAAQLKKGGVLLMSGLMPADGTDIVQRAAGEGLALQETQERSNWICLRFAHQG